MRLCPSLALPCLLLLLIFAIQRLAAQSVCTGDAAVVDAGMRRMHPGLFHHVPEAVFEQEVRDLRAAGEGGNRQDFVWRLALLTSSIGEAHTGIHSAPPAYRFDNVPLKLYAYSDGIHVQATRPEYRDLLSAKLVAIDGVPIKAAAARASTVTEGSNPWTLLDYMPYRLLKPGLLHRLGVAQAEDSVAYTFRSHGRTITRPLAPMPRKGDGSVSMEGLWNGWGPAPGSSWLDAGPAKPPLWLSRPDQLWFAHVAPSSLYIQVNAILDGDGVNLADFFRSAVASGVAHHDRVLVIDLRRNGGGDNTLLPPVMESLLQSPWAKARGRLYVAIGRSTASAAQNFVNYLQTKTRAVFLGEPTGESPNHYGDPDDLALPCSGIVLHVSTRVWQDMPASDHRVATFPDVSLPLTSTDYARGRDPVMEYVELREKRLNDRRL